MQLSEAGKAWLQGTSQPLTAEVIRLDDTQYKMYMSLKRLSGDFIGEELEELIEWMKNPDSLEKLKAISNLKREDLVLFPGEEVAKSDRNLPFGSALLHKC